MISLMQSLTNVPGPGSPSDDGPGALNYGWDWNTGSITEGTYNPRLTVWDGSGLSVSKTMFIGIDRTGPTMTTPTVGNGNGGSIAPRLQSLVLILQPTMAVVLV